MLWFGHLEMAFWVAETKCQDSTSTAKRCEKNNPKQTASKRVLQKIMCKNGITRGLFCSKEILKSMRLFHNILQQPKAA